MKKNIVIPTLALALSLGLLGTQNVLAATVTPAIIIAKADTTITSRISSLNKLNTRIMKFKNLSDNQKASLTATVQSSINAMNALKTKIDGETDMATIKTDVASITKAYRIYMLVIPSTNDIASTDNALGSITTLQTTLTKLNTRILIAQTAGKNVAAIQVSYTDATTKITDAQSQGNGIITALTSLKPDMGDKTVQTSNAIAIATAKADRKLLTTDLATARKDIKSIQAGLKALKA